MQKKPFDARSFSRPRALVLGVVLVAAAVSALAASPALAGKQPDVSVFLHVVPVEGKARTNCYAHGIAGFGDVVVDGPAGTAGAPKEYLVYVLIGGLDPSVGLTAVQFGIAYDPKENSGIDVLGWNDCALYEWHLEDWPQAGTGNLLTWDQNSDCQTESPVVVGFFRIAVHSPDRMRIIPRPVDGIISVASCGLNSTNHLDYVDPVKPENIGWAAFGDGKGYNPWDPEARKSAPKSDAGGK